MALDADRDRFSWIDVGRAFMLPQVILMAFVGFFTGTILSIVGLCGLTTPFPRHPNIRDGLVSLH